MLAVPRGGIEIHADLRLTRQPVPVPAAADHPRPEHGAQSADQRGHGLSRLGRRSACRVPQHVGDPVGGEQASPFHREQLQQRPGFAAANLARCQLPASENDAECPRESQFDP